jgi:hypothetical protein
MEGQGRVLHGCESSVLEFENDLAARASCLAALRLDHLSFLAKNAGDVATEAPRQRPPAKQDKAESERLAAELLEKDPALLDNIRELARRLGRSWEFTKKLAAVQEAQARRNEDLRRRKTVPLTDEMLEAISDRDADLRRLACEQREDDEGSPLGDAPSSRRTKPTRM